LPSARKTLGKDRVPKKHSANKQVCRVQKNTRQRASLPNAQKLHSTNHLALDKVLVSGSVSWDETSLMGMKLVYSVSDNTCESQKMGPEILSDTSLK
jgi:hypothetical protein